MKVVGLPIVKCVDTENCSAQMEIAVARQGDKKSAAASLPIGHWVIELHAESSCVHWKTNDDEKEYIIWTSSTQFISVFFNSFICPFFSLFIFLLFSFRAQSSGNC